jgi:ferredoxin-type protein NapF
MACVPAVSPFVSLTAALGARHFVPLTLMCLPLIILAFFKQRWFCWHLCPTGFIMDITSLRRRSHQHVAAGFPHLGQWLLMLGIGMAAAGYPLLTAFDPLTILTAFLSTWQLKNLEWQFFVPALPLLTLAALNIFRPNLWCHRLCPLGATQHFIGLAGRRFRQRRIPTVTGQLSDSDERWPSRSPLRPSASQGLAAATDLLAETPARGPTPPKSAFWLRRLEAAGPPTKGVGRRFFLSALLGAMAGWALIANKSRAAVVRPPGAVAEDLFTGLCARCGNCVNVCPESIIVPDLGSSGLRGLLTPVLTYKKAYCNEWCSKCLLVCPTRAIRRLSLDQKRALAVGKARIDKSLCLAWSKRQDCMVCQEFCPYQAIAIVQNDGVNCPEMKNEVCRGCGACESQCPAIPIRAITVQGARSQIPAANNAP